MFEKTQKAAVDLGLAVTKETNDAINMAKAMVVPTIAGLFGSVATMANKAKMGVESGEFLAKAKAAVNVAKAPAANAIQAPSLEDQKTIRYLREKGNTDEQIAIILNLELLAVKMVNLD